ncbi:MAG TPA: hypothetical protein VGD94_12670 [Vicinamibacterales bacterium]
MRSRAGLGVLVAVALATASVDAAGEYRTFEVESLRITIDSEWAPRIAPGYVPVRFDVTNLGEARVIEIVGQNTRYFRLPRMGPGGGSDVRQAVRLARGDRVRFTIPVPVYADNENLRFEIREEGRTLERFGFVTYQSRVPASDAAVLIVADSTTVAGAAAAGWRRMNAPSSMGGRSGSSTPRDVVLEPARIPENWLGYTSLRAVLIGPGEWKILTDAQRAALLSWTASGGDLLFVDGELSALFPPGQAPRDSGPAQRVRGYGFGRIHLVSSATMAAAGMNGVLKTAQSVQDPDWALPVNRSSDWGAIAGRGFRLLIPGINGVPARAYLLILIAFSVLIGPANYWFLWRKRQQTLMVLTVPLISGAFILLLGGYVLAGEGLGVYGRVVSFTMLDQARRQASTRSSASLYAAGMSPSSGLRFARDTAIFPVGTDGHGTRERFRLDLTEAQRFADGVIEARSPTNIDQIVTRAARERLTFTREPDGSIGVVNGLGVTLNKLLYHTGGRHYTLVEPLVSGGKGTLQPGARAALDIVPFDVPLSVRYRHLVENQPEGCYLAVLERSPFWDPGVDHLQERDSFHFVIGWPEGQP